MPSAQRPSKEFSCYETKLARGGEIAVSSTFRISFYIGALIAAMIGLWLTQLWQPAKQVRLHSENFIRQIENRNWLAADDFLAADYRDDWGHDREAIRNRLPLVLHSFSSLTITAADSQVSADSPAGWWSAKIQIAGRGSEFAPEIVSRVNRLTDPFVLHWRQESWRPWDWKLVRASNPSLEISSHYL